MSPFEFEQLVEDEFMADDLRLTTSLDPSTTPFTVSNYMQWLSAQEEALREVEENQQFPSANQNNSDLQREISMSSTESRAFGSTDSKSRTIFDRNNQELNVVECRAGGTRPVGLVSDWVLHEGWNAASMGSEEELDGAELSRVLDDVRNVELGLSSRHGLWASLTASKLPGQSQLRPGWEESRTLDRDTVKINSMQAKIHQQLTNGNRGRDVNSVSSTKEAPSLDLDWDHEPGMMNPGGSNLQRSATEEDLRDNMNRRDSVCSTDEEYHWEHDDFVNSSCIDKRHLLT